MICEHCGCFFCCDNVPDSAAPSPNDLQRYCGQTCATAARKVRRAERGFPLRQPPPIPPRGCKTCGIQFQRITFQQQYCSSECRDFARYHSGVPAVVLREMWAKRQEAQAPCPSGKIRHRNEADAHEAARTATHQRYGAFPHWLRIYRCPDCKDWHLTSKPRPRRKVP